MKKLLLLFLIFKITGLFAQYTQIPDTNFEQKLIDLGIDSDQTINGQVLNSDIENVTFLNIHSSGINDLTGIEGFINLDTLICYDNYIDNIDLSHNTKLKYLNLYLAGLQSLDVSNLTDLRTLKCHNDVLPDFVCDCTNNIQTLDLSNNLNLEYLECNETGLNTVVFPNSSNLKTVILVNQPLQSLDLSGLPGLETLIIPLNSINNLDLSNNTNLKYLDVNKSNMTSIDLSNNPNLETLLLGYYYASWEGIDEYGNDNNFSNIDISNLSNLKILYARKVGLNSIDLSNNNLLKYLRISVNPLHTIDVRNNPNLEYLDVNDCYLSGIDTSENSMLRHLIIGYSAYWFSNSTLYSNNISTLDISENINLDELMANDVQLNEIITTQNINITSLSAADNNLTQLPLKNYPMLDFFDISNNNFSSLDLSANIFLETVILNNNYITELSIASNPFVSTLYCSNNSLETLDIKNGHNLDLVYLGATNNPNLNCIQIDDINYIGTFWGKDAHTIYSTDCSAAEIVEIASSEITIYPNPVINYLYIENNSDIIFTQAKIYDISGKLITSMTNIENKINVSSLPNGFYILKLSNNKTSVTKKFIVKH